VGPSCVVALQGEKKSIIARCWNGEENVVVCAMSDFAAVYKILSLFWGVTQRRYVATCTTEVTERSIGLISRAMLPNTRCLETSVANYQSTLRNIADEQRPDRRLFPGTLKKHETPQSVLRPTLELCSPLAQTKLQFLLLNCQQTNTV
jgi:hypothetical protein